MDARGINSLQAFGPVCFDGLQEITSRPGRPTWRKRITQSLCRPFLQPMFVRDIQPVNVCDGAKCSLEMIREPWLCGALSRCRLLAGEAPGFHPPRKEAGDVRTGGSSGQSSSAVLTHHALLSSGHSFQ
jgi:hypothetical protein